MRTRTFIIVFALFVVSCVFEDPAQDTALMTFDCFSVSVEETQMTKVHIEDGGAVKWDVGDCIGIFSDTQKPEPYYRGEDGRFYGKAVTGSKFYAFSPYSDNAYNLDDPLKIRMDVGMQMALPMVAQTVSNELVFRQTCGVIHINNLSGQYSSVFLLGNDNENLGGAGIVDLSQDTPVFTLSERPEDVGQALEPVFRTTGGGKEDLYFCIPPITMSSGFVVRFIVESDNELGYSIIDKKTLKSVTIPRGVMKNYTLDLGEEIRQKEKGYDDEKAALISLYKALDGDNWIHNENWCTDKPFSEWYGINTTFDGHVSGIFLLSNRLRGEIPQEIGDLSELRIINFSTGVGGEDCNNITGHLPESVGNLENLEILVIDQSLMGGVFPECLRGLKNLKVLNLMGRVENGEFMDHEYYHGPLPEWIGELTELEELTLGNNKFEGDIPESFSRLTKLAHIEINANMFTGPLPDVSLMKDLVRVEYEGNYFTGGIPACYATVLDNKDLIEFCVIYNCLSGTIAPEVWSHPAFPEVVSKLLAYQREGYKLQIDETKVPASRWTYNTLDGGTLCLGELYSKARYTMLVRWAEWCIPSRGFLPFAIELANKYKDKGLQVIWSYAGGEEENRIQLMKELGLDKWDKHIVECEEMGVYMLGKDHPLWMQGFLFCTPFVEIVNSEGNIVYIDDEDEFYASYSFSHKRRDLEEILSQLLGGEETKYESSDFGADCRVHILQQSSIGAGVDIVLMGDAFSDRLIADGTYENVMLKAVDAFFVEEPYKSLRDYFNVYYVDVVSPNEVYYGETALGTWYGNGSQVGGDDETVFKYALKAVAEERLDESLMIVIMNRDYYAGTCYMYVGQEGDYGRGKSVSYFPASSDAMTFNSVLSHEAGGHGFAKLADEYSYPYRGIIPEEEKASYVERFQNGWYKNIDFTADPQKVKWSRFIADSRYESERLGVFEGACTYMFGAWRPTDNSIMNQNTDGFNAPSRYAIWYRINKLAFGEDWKGTYEDFVEFDLAHRPSASTKAASRNYVEKPLPPLHPPVVVNRK